MVAFVLMAFNGPNLSLMSRNLVANLIHYRTLGYEGPEGKLLRFGRSLFDSSLGIAKQQF